MWSMISETNSQYLCSNYHHDSAKYEKQVKLGSTNKQYVTVKGKVRLKLGLLWELGRSPKSTMVDFSWSVVNIFFQNMVILYIVRRQISCWFSSAFMLIQLYIFRPRSQNDCMVFYSYPFFSKVYDLGAYNECTKTNVNM